MIVMPAGKRNSKCKDQLSVNLPIPVHSSDHRRMVKSFSIDADAISFRVGCVCAI